MFSFSFHTALLNRKKPVLTLAKRDIDKACLDRDNKHFMKNFKIDLVFRYKASPDQLNNNGEVGKTTCSVCGKPIEETDISVDTGNG